MICSSGIGFDPVVDGTRLTFGFEGIYQGTAVLYDHQTGSLWMHLTGVCIEGKLEGTVLERLPTGRHTRWADWLGLHPGTDVIEPEVRWQNQVGDSGYFGEASSRSGSSFFPDTFGQTMGRGDDRLASNDLLYRVVVGDVARAYPFRTLARGPRVVEERVGDVDATVWFDATSRSVAAFDRRVGDRRLTFEAANAGWIKDAETSSLWTMDGRCIEGALRDRQLRPLFGLMAEWYGWYANHPDTTVFER